MTVTTGPFEHISPNVISFLPILYVAWADAILTPTEIELIQQKINAQNWLEKPEKEQLSLWLDPIHKPDAAELQLWLQLIRQQAPPPK